MVREGARVMSLHPTAKFDPSTESDLAGYRYYYGLSPGSYINFIEILVPCRPFYRWSCPPLTKNVTNYFRITAFDNDNNETLFADTPEFSHTPTGGLTMK